MMSEQIEVKLTFNFADDGEPEVADTIQVNGGKVEDITNDHVVAIEQILTTGKQLRQAEQNESSSKSEQWRLKDAKKQQVKKLGKA